MQGYIEKFLNHHPESRIKYLASSSLLTVDCCLWTIDHRLSYPASCILYLLWAAD